MSNSSVKRYSDFVSFYSKNQNITKQDADFECKAVLEALVEFLLENEKVQLKGFGTFEHKVRKGRPVTIPTTGVEVVAKDTSYIKFSVAQSVRDALN